MAISINLPETESRLEAHSETHPLRPSKRKIAEGVLNRAASMPSDELWAWLDGSLEPDGRTTDKSTPSAHAQNSAHEPSGKADNDSRATDGTAAQHSPQPPVSAGGED